MTIFDFKKTKAGFTLVEMVITLAILSVLMTSTMGMVVSSNNLFISTSKASLDKKVGNGVFDLISNIMRYSTHLTMYDQDAQVSLGSSQGFSISVTDEATESGIVQFKSSKDTTLTNLYDASFYNGRTIQYKLEKVGNSNNHVRITVSVVREGEVVYTRSEVIKCINLSLITSGSNKNTIVDKSTAGSSNQKLVFSCDEQLITGGKEAYSLEYKIGEYMAKYNEIQRLYAADLNKAVGILTGKYDDAANRGLKGTKNTTGNRMPQALYIQKMNTYARIVFGTGTNDYKYDETNILNCTNLRAYYQNEIKELLTFMPTAAGFSAGSLNANNTVTAKNDASKTIKYSKHSGDPYYGVVATKEELYTGFMLKYYDTDKDGKVTQAEFPAFSDADTFFKGTSISSYLSQTSSSNKNKMVILAYFVDNVTDDDDDTTNVEYKQQLISTNTENVYATDGAKSTALAMLEGTTLSDTSTYSATSAEYIVKSVGCASGDFATFKMHYKVNNYMYYKFGTGTKGDYTYRTGPTALSGQKLYYDFTQAAEYLSYKGQTYYYSESYSRIHTSSSDKSWEENGHYYKFASAIGAMDYNTAKNDLASRLASNGVSLTYIRDKNISVNPANALTNGADNPKTIVITANENLTEGVYCFYLKYNHPNTGYANEHANFIFVLKGADTIVNVSTTGVVTGTSTANDVKTNRVAVPKGGTITLNLSDYRLTSYSYQQAQYRKADSGAIYEIPTEFPTYYAHQFNDYALYGVDWNSWFVATPTGLTNKILTGAVSLVQRLFGKDYNKDITYISKDNAVKALGNIGTYTVNSVSTSTGSFNMAWCVYVPSTGTWYYLPSASTRVSNAVSKISFSSSKDAPTPIDVELGNGATWYNSTAMSYDIKNRKLSATGLWGLIDTTKDQNWVSLPVGNESAVTIE